MPKVIQNLKSRFIVKETKPKLLPALGFKPSVEDHIQFYRRITSAGLSATFLFILLTLLILTPLDLSGEKSLAASGDTSTTSLTLATSGSAELDLLVTDDSGTFASNGTPLTFNVSTNNYTGYTVSIRAKSDTTLTNTTSGGGSFTSISGTGITSETFNTSTYNGMWGIKPNYYDSEANTDKFYPSPTTSGVTLRRTESANVTGTPDSYSIGIAARATYAQAAGTYSNTYILNAIGNYPAYTITYDANGGSGAPDTQSATGIANNSVQVKLQDTRPTRTGYTFAGWCSIDNSANSSTCNGDTYKPSDPYTLDTINSNTVKLYAIWTIQSFTCKKQYRLQNADGSYPSSYTSGVTQSVNYGATCSYSQSYDGYVTQSTSGTMGVSGLTLSLDLPRNTYTLTVNGNTSYISSVSGGGTYRWGQSVSISATVSSGNKFTGWSQTSGATGSFGNTSSASTTFTMPKSNATVYANGAADKLYMWNATSADCGKTMYDNRDGTERAYTTKSITAGGTTLCWMTTNLMLGKSTTTALTSSTSNVPPSGYTLPASSTSGFARVTDQNIYNSESTTCSSSSACYGYYTYTAATAGSNPSSGDAGYDICPKGWRLPTQTEFTTLKNSYSTGALLVTSWSAVYSGYYLSSTFNSGGSIGSYWSSTAHSAYYSYNLFIRNDVDADYTGNKCYGFSIRCVAKS